MSRTRKNDDARARGEWQGMNWCRKDLRLAVYLRDGMSCMWCGSTLEDGAQLTLDHVVPHSKGGSNKPANIICACHKCNSVRADRDAAEFAGATAGYLNRGITAEDILSAIEDHLNENIARFRTEAKAIIARRPSWQAALKAATKI